VTTATDPLSTQRAQSLAQGAVGEALLPIERALSGTGPWDAAQAALAAVLRNPLEGGDQAALYLGAPAAAFVLHLAAADTDRYQRALRTLDTAVTNVTHRRLDAAHARINSHQRPRPAEYDLLHGLTGLGVYLHRRDPGSQTLHRVLRYLVRLTEPLTSAGETLPGWWVRLGPTHNPDPVFALGGHGNLGMAHGITGPLAFLSRCLRHGIAVLGQAEAIERICSWLDQTRQDSATGPWWPKWITLPEQRDHAVTQAGPTRPSWCYGTPGIAFAQQLAGIALSDPARQSLAEGALLLCLADPAQLDQITEPGLCHGAAGLLRTVRRAAQDARCPDAFTAHLPTLLEQLNTQQPSGHAGLLDGTTGPALVLHAEHRDTDPVCDWDACLLLA